MYRINKKVSGESVVEVMAAMAIASILIIGAIELVSRSYSIVGETNKKIEAMNLAQEGIEIVRNTRDTNWLKYSGDMRANWLKTKTTTDQDTFLDAEDDEFGQFINVDSDGTVEVFSNQSEIREIFESFDKNLDFVDIETGGSNGQDIYNREETENDQDKYFRIYKDQNGVLTSDQNAVGAKASEYYRGVEVQTDCANSDNNCDKKISITSRVKIETL